MSSASYPFVIPGYSDVVDCGHPSYQLASCLGVLELNLTLATNAFHRDYRKATAYSGVVTGRRSLLYTYTNWLVSHLPRASVHLSPTCCTKHTRNGLALVVPCAYLIVLHCKKMGSQIIFPLHPISVCFDLYDADTRYVVEYLSPSITVLVIATFVDYSTDQRHNRYRNALRSAPIIFKYSEAD